MQTRQPLYILEVAGDTPGDWPINYTDKIIFVESVQKATEYLFENHNFAKQEKFQKCENGKCAYCNRIWRISDPMAKEIVMDFSDTDDKFGDRKESLNRFGSIWIFKKD